jgi:hypothetical protein
MFAQIVTFEESPEQLTEGLRHLREEVVPSVGAADGLHGAYWLVDREHGRRLTLMFWASESAQAAAMPGIIQGVGTRRAAGGRTNPANAPTNVSKYEIFAQAAPGRVAEVVAASA